MNEPAPPAAQIAAQHEFPCGQCGALLQYAPGTERLQCGYCGFEQAIPQTAAGAPPIEEQNFLQALNTEPDDDDAEVTLTVKCGACAAEFQFDPNIHSDACPFCGTRIVADTREQRHFQPAGILPFKITAGKATESYRRWLRRLWFAPNKLKQYARKDTRLNGMYLPYWTYDCNTGTDYAGERGTVYQVPIRVQSRIDGRLVTQTQYVTKIRWTPVSGAVTRSFDDVTIFASHSVPRTIARELAPWDLENLEPYREEFLSGFRSEVYQVNLKDGFDIARERMATIIRADIARDIGGDQQRIGQMNTRYDDIRFKHILLPFWTAGFRFRNKIYQFVVNGRSGEVQGERPYSPWKIAFAIVGLTLLALLVIAALSGPPQSDSSAADSTSFSLQQ